MILLFARNANGMKLNVFDNHLSYYNVLSNDKETENQR